MKHFILASLSLFILISTEASFAKIEQDHKSLYLFGGLDLGYSKLESDVNGESSNSDGFIYGGRLLANYLYDRWSFNGGIGYFDLEYESNIVQNRIVKLTTKTIFLEVNPQFRFTNRHSAGILWNQIIGEKLLVGPSSIDNSDNPEQTTSTLLGVNYYYSIPWKSMRMRLGAQLTKPISIGDRSSYTAMFSVQLGFPLIKNKRQQLIRKKRVEKSELQITLDTQFINFNSNSSILNQKSKALLAKLGSFLSENLDAWSEISVEGHTDQQGAESYNLGLSLERARSVTTELVNAGAPDERISLDGFGETQLLDENKNKAAHQKNRRVEIHFIGKTDKAEMNEFFDRFGK